MHGDMQPIDVSILLRNYSCLRKVLLYDSEGKRRFPFETEKRYVLVNEDLAGKIRIRSCSD